MLNKRSQTCTPQPDQNGPPAAATGHPNADRQLHRRSCLKQQRGPQMPQSHEPKTLMAPRQGGTGTISFFWRPGSYNRGDNFAKHHCPLHHVKMIKEFLTSQRYLEDLHVAGSKKQTELWNLAKLSPCHKDNTRIWPTDNKLGSTCKCSPIGIPMWPLKAQNVSRTDKRKKIAKYSNISRGER